MLRREDGEADFSRTAVDLDRRRRGFTPWPGLWTRASGSVLKIHDSEPLPSGGRAPGEIVAASAAGIDVSGGGGTVLRLREVQPEGRKRMPASAYVAGHPLRPGDRLGT
jgi:methionyl-tRNA formyltransferase